MPEIKCPHCGKTFTVDESGYAAIVAQVRDGEFHKSLEERLKQIEKEKATELELVESKAEREKEQAVTNLTSQINELKAKLSSSEKDTTIAVNAAVQKSSEVLAAKDKQIMELQNSLNVSEKDKEIEKESLRNQFIAALKEKDAEIAFYKDMKAKMSTKMVGETLEQHCEIEFNRLRATAFQGAYFEKDNDAKTGSKGDYIFRDSKDGTEYISIMFEMKNEMDTTATKHKNEDFLKELDKDRREKDCEYAVLVSMLEADNELYNGGIVDVSHKYEKMYVVRPQCFIPIITLLRNAALKSLEYKRQIAEYKQTNIDVSNFESEMNSFKEKFGRDYSLASTKFKKAIEEIDKTIEHLQKTKDALIGSEDHLRLANNKAQDLSIKRLTKNNPTMTKAFEDLKKQQ